jgi:hypothetical protein
MRVLEYFDLNTHSVRDKYIRARDKLAQRRFQELDVRKLANSSIFRAKLDDTNRLLFSFAKFGQETCLLILEVILNHRYEKSIFIGGKQVRENDFVPIQPEPTITESYSISFINQRSNTFHLLDKPISFDDSQEEIFSETTPLLIVGAAGCGKTAIAVEKIRNLRGRILYVSLSPYLVEATRSLFHNGNLFTEEHEVDFLSLAELIQTIEIPEGKEIQFRDFESWARCQNGVKTRDCRKLFEEFRGVLLGAVTQGESLSVEEYMTLGVRESIIPTNERQDTHRIFRAFLQHLVKSQQYDLSLLCSRHLPRVSSQYDYLVVDEIQDFTITQLRFVLAWLREPTNFILCGDAHQVVHPNLFSWAKLKSFLYRTHDRIDIPDSIKILQANFRNSESVTTAANMLLRLKKRRFGSIDKESDYLVTSQSGVKGAVHLLRCSETLIKSISDKVRLSTSYAVIVLADEQKDLARSLFGTPLVFSVHEAKGLEYQNAILFGFAQHAEREYREIASDISVEELDQDLAFSRPRDKSDKTAEVYKFYTNALYVALTRAMGTVLIVDSEPDHRIFSLLGLTAADSIELAESKSSREDWQREARRLELQGKLEQAEEIHKKVLDTQPIQWKVAGLSDLKEIIDRLRLASMNQEQPNKKDQLMALEHSILFGTVRVRLFLAQMGYSFAGKPSADIFQYVREKYMLEFSDRLTPSLQRKIDTYGINHRSALGDTPLISATRCMLPGLCRALLDQGADPEISSSAGITPLRALFLTLKLYSKLPPKQIEAAGSIFNLIAPSAVSIRIGSQLIKIDRSKAEFLLLELMLSEMVYNAERIESSPWGQQGFSAAELADGVEIMPDAIVPRYRKESRYISAMLSKNEIDSNSPYSRRLFLRVRRGYYLLNPRIDLKIKDKWVPWFEAIELEKLLALMSSDASEKFPAVANSTIKWLRLTREAATETKAFGSADLVGNM